MDVEDIERERSNALDALILIAQQTPSIRGLWLQGSLACGESDPFSDIDAYLAIDDDAFEAMFSERESFLRRVGPILAWANATTPGLKCVHALLTGGVRLDLFFEPASRVSEQERPTAKVLVDKGDLATALRLGWRAPMDAIGRVVSVIIRMTRQGGTWPLRVIRRGQWSTFAMMELDLINAQVAQLMAVQIDPALFYQNTFSLSRRLRPDQRAELDALTDSILEGVARRDRAALLQTHLQVLDALVREGRAACQSLGIVYPVTDEGDVGLRELLEAAWPK